MKYLLIFLLAAIGCNHVDTTCAVIHQPKTGCPTGYVRESKPRFTERNGSREYACAARDPKKEQCFDVLKPGESVGFTVIIPAEDAAPTKPSNKL
jgi:hypothetical protein